MKYARYWVVLGGFLLMAGSSGGVEYFVDAKYAGAAGAEHKGLSEGDAFGTIQEAVDAAAENGESGDIITVLPGTYDAGYGTYTMTDSLKTNQPYTNRVLIAESNITLRSKEGAANTFIVGKHDDTADAKYYGMGPGAISCVLVKGANTKDVRIIGFTLKDGSAQRWNDGGGDILPGSGGGVYSENSSGYVRVIDCVITNCVGARAGAMRRCTAVRCEIVDCTGQAGAAIARDSNLLHCYIHHNTIRDCGIMSCKTINCTVVENFGTGNIFSQDNYVYNSVVLHNVPTYIFPKVAGLTNKLLANSVLTALNSQAIITTITESVTNAAPFQFLAPLFGDYRPINSGELVGRGDAAHIGILTELSAAEEPYVSFDHKIISTTGTCQAGAFQEVVTPAGGVHYFSKVVCAKGRVGAIGGLYAFSLKDKDVFTATKNPAETTELVFNQQIYGTIATTRFVWPEMDDSVYFMMPPAGQVATNTFAYASKTLYVNPAGVDDDTESGRGESADKPYKTLQYAVNQAPITSTKQITIIHAAAGTYEEGTTIAQNWPTRLVVENRYLRIKGAGRESTFIRGATDHTDEDEYGRGPNGVRCVCGNGWACVQGFTLVDGRGDIGNAMNGKYYGGLVISDDINFTVADCALTGGAAFRGSVSYGVCSIMRCVITNNVIFSGGGMRYNEQVKSCFACDNRVAESSAYLSEATVRDSTFVALENTGANKVWNYNSSLQSTFTDSILWGNGKIGYSTEASAGVIGGSVFGNNTDLAAALNQDPCFVDANGSVDGDYRVFMHSPAMTSAEVRDDEWLQSLTDVMGRPRRFINGKPIAGAFHDTPMQVKVTVPTTTSLTQGEAGNHTLEAGESYTITYAAYEGAAGTRPVICFNVNGEDVPINEARSYTWTFPADYGAASYTAAFGITLIAQTNLYVDVKGKAGNDGFYPGEDHAFATLAEAYQVAVQGDTVHVAPGTYEAGEITVPNTSAFASAAGNCKTRLLVSAGVTYVSDEGAEKTIIMGAKSSSGDAYGLGVDAVRCVTMRQGVLDGFTLTGGHTDKPTNTNNGDALGGGVLCENSYNAIVKNCVISNNFARRGGGGAFGKYVNCRFLENYADTTSSGLYYGHGYGCLFDGNYGLSQVWRCYQHIENCTITAGNWGNAAKTKEASLAIDDSPTVEIINSIILGQTDINGKEALKAKNSIFVAGKTYSSANWDDACVEVAADAIATVVDANFVPVKGGAAIDKGGTVVDAAYGGKDACGAPRMLNGAMDIGAMEYDWRVDYAADLGGSMVVTAASPKTFEATSLAGNVVTLKEGALAATLQKVTTQTDTKFTLPFEVLGDGTLSVSVNGGAAQTFTKADGATAITFTNKLAANEVVYTYTADDAGVRLGAVQRKSHGFKLFIR